MIEFAMETPKALHSSLQHWSDFDFVLAHNVLDDSSYAYRLQNRRSGRMLIMDNSMHELGEALPIDKLLLAAKKCSADYVIPPDRLDAPAWNVQQFYRACKQFAEVGTSVAAVMCGEDTLDRQFALDNYTERTSMLLLPYRKPRLKWYLEHRTAFHLFDRIHLLGVNTLEELGLFAAATNHDTSTKWSVDTAKPLKWALQGQSLLALESVRGAAISSKELLELVELTQEVKDLAYENVKVLKDVCR